jgi:hypothetical protein
MGYIALQAASSNWCRPTTEYRQSTTFKSFNLHESHAHRMTGGAAQHNSIANGDIMNGTYKKRSSRHQSSPTPGQHGPAQEARWYEYTTSPFLPLRVYTYPCASQPTINRNTRCPSLHRLPRRSGRSLV